MSTPDLKVGDHIRVTDVIEGKVTKIESYGVWMERAEGAGPHVWIDTNTPGWHRTFETVVPPEPEWVNGDVIEIKQALSGWNGYTLHRIDGRWVWADGDATTNLGVTNCWKRDEVRIVYKHDQRDVA